MVFAVASGGLPSVIEQILAICDLVTGNHDIAAVEINPLMITANKAVVADALLWCYEFAP